jgi:glucose-6-phosphate-specific signal transduction histidine kinase
MTQHTFGLIDAFLLYTKYFYFFFVISKYFQQEKLPKMSDTLYPTNLNLNIYFLIYGSFNLGLITPSLE